MKSFQKVIDRATKAMISLSIKYHENIIPEQRKDNEKTYQDYRLTRFACYLVAMNGDPKKPEVANAQAYFISQARQFELLFEGQNEIDRIINREELSEGYTSLASTAKRSGVSDYAKFMDAGYLGMYNMQKWKLSQKRGIESKKLLEHMGRLELAANTFRVALTEERIKSQNVRGQANLEEAHFGVGQEVRCMVIKNTGQYPENLKPEKEIRTVKKELKNLDKEMQKLDKPKNKNKK